MPVLACILVKSKIDTPVVSLPVPAVVGIAINGFRGPGTGRPLPMGGFTLCLAKTPSGQKLQRSIDILTVKSYLYRPTRARWKAMKIQADRILTRDTARFQRCFA